MAAPLKVGLDYFPLDVDADQDDKLSMIIGEFGEKGELLYLKLCGWIYKHGGYCIKWNEQELLKFAKRVAYIGGSSVNLIKEIVARCIKWGLFDQSVFESSKILTSIRIQTTWCEATRKRKDRIVNGAVWLLPAKSSQNVQKVFAGELMPEETQEKPELIVQSKSERESKVNDYVGVPPPKPPVPPKPPKPAAVTDLQVMTMDQLTETAKTDVEILEWGYQQGVMPEDLPAVIDQFHKHCKNIRKKHLTIAQYQSHLVFWYPKRPKNENAKATSAETDEYIERRRRSEERDRQRQ